jgi:hypothetical protein
LDADQAAISLDLDEVIDRQALAKSLPAATAHVLSEQVGGSSEEWERVYRAVLADWDSYWEDLTLNEDDSLEQWREGRWRIYAALFRLTGRPIPPKEQIGAYLDDLQPLIGRRCAGWREGAIQKLRGEIANGQPVTIRCPSLPAGVIRGMLDAVGISAVEVIGPDEAEKWMG